MISCCRSAVLLHLLLCIHSRRLLRFFLYIDNSQCTCLYTYHSASFSGLSFGCLDQCCIECIVTSDLLSKPSSANLRRYCHQSLSVCRYCHLFTMTLFASPAALCYLSLDGERRPLLNSPCRPRPSRESQQYKIQLLIPARGGVRPPSQPQYRYRCNTTTRQRQKIHTRYLS